MSDPQYGHLPTKSLARLLVEREPALFKGVEDARSRLRQALGHYGVISRNKLNPSLYRPKGHQSDGWIPLPGPLREPDEWQIVPVDFNRALILADVHLPFHDAVALEAALDYGTQRNADCVVLLGDVMDFYTCSYFEKDPRLRHSLHDEIELGRRFLEHLRGRFPKARIIYKEGNHEERLWRYAWTRCPEFFTLLSPDTGVPLLSLASLMDFAEYGVDEVANKQPLRCGPHLHLLHGHEFPTPFFNPVNPARGLFLRAQCNCAAGHLHQTSNHTESGLAKTVSTFGLGCLANLRPKYRPINKWNHGFGWCEMAGESWSLENLKVIKGKVV